MKKSFFSSAFFLIWFAGLIAIYFIVQKPAFINVGNELFFFLASILFDVIFSFVAIGIGYWILSHLIYEIDPGFRCIFSFGIGMGVFGLLGFAGAVIGVITKYLVIILLLGLFVLFRKQTAYFLQDCKYLLNEILADVPKAPSWVPLFSVLLFLFALLYSFAPPVEGFDGLFYHLTVPSLWLIDSGLRLVNIPHYWFPSLMEGIFIWPLSIGFESSPQFIHFSYSTVSCLLIWKLTKKIFGSRSAWWSLAILISMPSLPWLASWAYTDFGLIYYSLATLLTLVLWKEMKVNGWLLVCGMFVGFAVGIKYTSFLLPIVVIFFVFLWKNEPWGLFLKNFCFFVGVMFLCGGIWYIRNWIWTGNPVYPFVFGGIYWDGFRENWYSGAGSGIGWNLFEIAMLPFSAMLGYKDQNFFDGRFGPLFLFLLPFAVIVVLNKYKYQKQLLEEFVPFLVFALFFSFAWVFGVINTIYLFQARLLWPGLMALIPVLAAGAEEIENNNWAKFRTGFVFSVITGILVFVLILDYGLFILLRNPLRVALGFETRVSYISRMQPEYGQALQLLDSTPKLAYVYLLSEPRSYGMNRKVQPDPILDNLPHDFYLYESNEELIDAWKKNGYTHLLARRTVFFPLDKANRLDEDRLFSLMNDLMVTNETNDFILFEIP